jgi:hypothetical protein
MHSPTELLPLVMDLVEDVNAGKTLPKDLANEANSVRQRLKQLRARVAEEMEGVIDADREALEKDIERKQKVLQAFKQRVVEDKSPDNDIDIDMDTDANKDTGIDATTEASV